MSLRRRRTRLWPRRSPPERATIPRPHRDHTSTALAITTAEALEGESDLILSLKGRRNGRRATPPSRRPAARTVEIQNRSACSSTRRVSAYAGFSLAFHPRYVVNGRAYVYYVGRDGATYVAEIRTVRGFAASRRVLLRIPASRAPYAHYGGHVLFGPDGLLYVSIGDGGVPATAQDPDVLLGKIVRLRVGEANAKPEIVASGLRNPWRFWFTRDGSALVIGDVGANRREEIDVVRRRLFGRANLGWPWFEGTVRRARPEPDGRSVLVKPFVEYGHARKRCYSVVGGIVYRGALFPDLRGRHIFGDLCGGMWSVRLSGHAARRSLRAEPFAALGILTSIAESADRELLLVGGDGSIVSPVPG